MCTLDLDSGREGWCGVTHPNGNVSLTTRVDQFAVKILAVVAQSTGLMSHNYLHFKKFELDFMNHILKLRSSF